MFNCHHFATDFLHEYDQFTVYHLEVSRGHLQCCEAQPISAISSQNINSKAPVAFATLKDKESGHDMER